MMLTKENDKIKSENLTDHTDLLSWLINFQKK